MDDHGAFLGDHPFMPHGQCFLWRTPLVLLHVSTDSIIGLAYLSISISLYLLVRKINLPFSGMFVAFGLFIGACGLTHFMKVWTMWTPDYWLSGGVNAVTAIASVATAIYIYPITPQIVRVAEEAKLAEQHRLKLASYSEELEARVRERTAELESALEEKDQALALRTEFLSIAAHELRTPLASAAMRIGMLKRLALSGTLLSQPPENTLKALQVAASQIGRLSTLTDELLDISRLTANRFELQCEETDLHELVTDMVDQFRALASQSGSDLNYKPPVETLVGHFDRTRIEQVVSNLLSNAIKFGKAKPIDVALRREGAEAVLEVTDLGIGIDPEQVALIFGLFERAAKGREIGGLGLGLYVARQIIERHHGQIMVESALENGSTFIVRLPLGRSRPENGPV
jgi:signal transduction histidine kinase